uniref:Uncharacterized protein n=1 Tax=Plectus sambesii TaxID=2011161 RepID=A0A914XDT0_9BILA
MRAGELLSAPGCRRCDACFRQLTACSKDAPAGFLCADCRRHRYRCYDFFGARYFLHSVDFSSRSPSSFVRLDMGNSKSTGHGASKYDNPALRSISWQPNPAFPSVGHYPGGMPPPHEYGRQRSHSTSNGSVLRDDSKFGANGHGLIGHKSQQERASSSTALHNPPPETSPLRRNAELSPNKTTQPGTSDSGYFTGVDSDPKSRTRNLRGSRLSLNEAVFLGNAPAGHPHHGPPPPHSGNFGAPPYGYPPMNQPPPGFMPPPFDPFFGPPPPDCFDSKKMKKWKKKQKKLMKRGSFPTLGEFPGPMGPYGPYPPHMYPVGPPGPGYAPFGQPYRAQSVGNLPDQCAVTEILPPAANRAYGSQSELLWTMHNFPSPAADQQSTTASAKGGSKKEKKKDSIGPPRSVHSSLSGKGSRRSRQEATHFEEERQLNSTESGAHMLMTGSLLREDDSPKDQQAVIYETLKAQRQRTMVATAEVAAEQENISIDISQESPETSAEDGDERNDQKSPLPPLKISPEAQAIMDRNAQLFPKRELPQATKMPPAPFVEAKTDARKDTAPSAEPSSAIDTAREAELTAVVNDVIPRRKPKRPKQLEPLDAWRAIDVSDQVNARQPQRNWPPPPCVAQETINVRLVPVAPGRTDSQSEPIYQEYDEKLPEFKKRLIETGSFDISDHDRRFIGSDQSTPKVERKDEPLGDYHRKQNGNGNGVDHHQHTPEDRPAPRRIAPSPLGTMNGDTSRSNMKANDHSTWLRTRMAEQRKYDSNGSLTPSTANIKAGDMSDIDFSWVHDLETRMQREGADDPRMRVGRPGFRTAHSKESIPDSTTIETNGGRRSQLDDNKANRYFGMYSAPQMLVTDDSRKELDAIRSNVRSKAAMFESEAQRAEREMCERREQIGRHRQSRSSSAPRYDDPEGPYIPHPDYTAGANDDRYMLNAGYNALSVDTSAHNHHHQQMLQQQQQQRNFYNYQNGRDHDPISPSERRIRRLEPQRQQQIAAMNASFESSSSGGGMHMGGGKFAPESRLSAYDAHFGQMKQQQSPRAMMKQQQQQSPRAMMKQHSPRAYDSAELLQRGRRYDATEYYRQNIRAEKEREVAAKAQKKGWFGSLSRSRESLDANSRNNAVHRSQPALNHVDPRARYGNGYH